VRGFSSCCGFFSIGCTLFTLNFLHIYFKKMFRLAIITWHKKFTVLTLMASYSYDGWPWRSVWRSSVEHDEKLMTRWCKIWYFGEVPKEFRLILLSCCDDLERSPVLWWFGQVRSIVADVHCANSAGCSSLL
jgi:hypothetical protein